jgi:hypothetical protein
MANTPQAPAGIIIEDTGSSYWVHEGSSDFGRFEGRNGKAEAVTEAEKRAGPGRQVWLHTNGEYQLVRDTLSNQLRQSKI